MIIQLLFKHIQLLICCFDLAGFLGSGYLLAGFLGAKLFHVIPEVNSTFCYVLFE